MVIFYKKYKFKRVSASLEMTSKEINHIGNTLSAVYILINILGLRGIINVHIEELNILEGNQRNEIKIKLTSRLNSKGNRTRNKSKNRLIKK